MTTEKPLISILMPYYELGDFLLEAVDSVLAQTYTNWQLQIVDDCSPTAPAREVLGRQSDPRVKIIRNENNLGCAISRNVAAAQSKGELFLPLDGDDKLAPTYIERTLKAMEDAQASAAYTDVSIFGVQNDVYTPSTDLGDIFTGHYPHNTLLLRREAFENVGGYKSSGIDDTEFWIALIELGTKFAYVPEPLYFYRRHFKSMTQSAETNLHIELLKVMIEHHESVEPYIPRILQKWIDVEEYRISTISETNKQKSEFDHLQKEFDALKQRYESLEKRLSRNEDLLHSVPGITKQIAYLTLKKIGIR